MTHGDPEFGTPQTRNPIAAPIRGILKAILHPDDLVLEPEALEMPDVYAVLDELGPGEFLLVTSDTMPVLAGAEVSFRDNSDLSTGHRLAGRQVRIGELHSGTLLSRVVIKSFTETRADANDATEIDKVVREAAASRVINTNQRLARSGIRAARLVGFCRYAITGGALQAENQQSIITAYEDTAVTLDHYLSQGGNETTTHERRLQTAARKMGLAVGLAHRAGIILGEPDVENVLLDTRDGGVVLVDLVSSRTFSEAEEWGDDLKSSLMSEVGYFAGTIRHWERTGRITTETAAKLIRTYNAQYRAHAYRDDTAVPPEARLRKGEIVNDDI